jgi:hypothetical protein
MPFAEMALLKRGNKSSASIRLEVFENDNKGG